MNNQILVETIGKYGIFKFIILDTYNVVNLNTKEIMPVMNHLSLESAKDYIMSL